jgi:nucleotide-binding universal stress UspA family protein
MKTILVPTDFSKPAYNAALFAIHLAEEMKAKVLLYHVYDFPIGIAGDVAVPLSSPDELQRESENLLKKTVQRLQKISSIEIRYKAKLGSVVDKIREEEDKATCIVMGMQGSGKLTELLVGSVTTAILKKTKKPVLVIPEKAKYIRPKKIVLATDYDPTVNLNSLKLLKSFIKLFDSEIFLVNVRNKKALVTKENTMAENNLESALKGAHHYYYYSDKDDLVEGINEFVKIKKADMIAIVPHKYSFFNNLFHKSVSKKMAFHTKLPLLALPDNHKSIPAYLI